MSENPYAAQPAESSDFGSAMPPAPSRISLLAIGSLVLSLVCCIPGLPTLGSVLGVFSLISITKNGPALRGKALAIIAIVLGTILSIGQVVLAIGAAQQTAATRDRLEIVADAQAGDHEAVRRLFDSSVSPTAEEIDAFGARVTEVVGAWQGTEQNLVKFYLESVTFQQYVTPEALAGFSQAAFDRAFSGQQPTAGLATFDQGKAAIIIEHDAGGAGFTRGATDVIVLAPDGDVISMLDGAIAQQILSITDASGGAGASEDAEQDPVDSEPPNGAGDAPTQSPEPGAEAEGDSGSEPGSEPGSGSGG
ncbi:MAG: DUF4190 domain-containing protein [Planctomycetota bacterium]